jgi:hypothetical protein
MKWKKVERTANLIDARRASEPLGVAHAAKLVAKQLLAPTKEQRQAQADAVKKMYWDK